MISDHLPRALIQQIAEYLRNQCTDSIRRSFTQNQFDKNSVTASFFSKIEKKPDKFKGYIYGEENLYYDYGNQAATFMDIDGSSMLINQRGVSRLNISQIIPTNKSNI
ncbi:hypothetical protein [Flagellimonas eckloniae]|uniref:Uncharacterized protein n=1 Tax=Flagellimonas eckloniae TaxID=346185 RepID=A0A0Q0WXL0_9FLAO|nr:hypothetical protein [Allomuricauda eckloniae]KQC30225.1 hypothetical protein AAY42_10320 [Allomuricauda eckloniae]